MVKGEVQLQIQSGSTGDIIRNLESGQINLGFIRPVETAGCASSRWPTTNICWR
jgi:hypothetical protein